MEKQGLHAAFVTCEFQNAMLDAKVFMDDQGRVKGLFFEPTSAAGNQSSAAAEWKTPSYVNTDLFHDRDTNIISGRWELPAVLTLPNTKTAVPAVILVHGSGPQDADETLGANKPFADLAYGLASQNVAVLRYVKRTKQYGADSKSDAPFTVKDEVTDDVIAAVALLYEDARDQQEADLRPRAQPRWHASSAHRRRRSPGCRHHHHGGHSSPAGNKSSSSR